LIFIRPFQPEDFHDVIEIEHQIFQEHDPYNYMELYESTAEGFLVAVDKGNVIGYIVGFISIPNKGRIFTLAVKENYRNMGIGTSLMKRMCEIFKEKGVKQVSLEVRINNISAQQFYIKKGFVPIMIERGYYSDGEDSLVLTKELH
jgi:ribosomal-protein-alanine N-acetyltransferase